VVAGCPRRTWSGGGRGWVGGVIGARAADEGRSEGVIYRGINGGWRIVVLTARNQQSGRWAVEARGVEGGV
jgi:hypothetical protein